MENECEKIGYPPLRRFKIKAPLGSYVVSKEEMDSREIREFAISLIKDPAWESSWKEKVENEPIEAVVDWLKSCGYEIEEIKS